MVSESEQQSESSDSDGGGDGPTERIVVPPNVNCVVRDLEAKHLPHFLNAKVSRLPSYLLEGIYMMLVIGGFV